MQTNRGFISTSAIILFCFCIVKPGFTQTIKTALTEKSNQIKFCSLDSWYSRTVKESSIIGGATKQLFEIGKPDSLFNLNDPLSKDSDSPWATTNIYAKMGIEIGNECVFPEERNNGYACRLETRIRKIDLFCLKVEVLVSGALFLGEMVQPVKNVKNPIQKIDHGIPFQQKPKAIKFDYKYNSGKNRVHSVYNSKPVSGIDKAELCIILQKRYENENGNVIATRIGGTRQFFESTNNQWINDTTITIHYGDITNKPFYNAETMGLIPEVNELYVKNSKNKMVPLVEKEWGNPGDTPTHLVMYFASSYNGINFTGSPESVLWVDNIELIY